MDESSEARVLSVGSEDSLVRAAAVDQFPDGRSVRLETVGSPVDARSHLAEETVDCLVLALDDEAIDGPAFLSGFRIDRPDVPVLAVTSADEAVDAAIEAGATDVFVRRAGIDEASLLGQRLANLVSRAPDRTASQEFANLLDTIDDPFYLLDETGDLVRWNETFRRVSGYTDDEIAEMHPTDFFAGADADRVAEAIGEATATGSVKLEADFATKGGDRIPFEFSGSRLTDEDGSIRGIVGIARNVADRKRRERRIERERNRLETTFQATPYPLVRVAFADGTPIIDQINAAFEETFGFDADTVVGAPVDEYIVPEDNEDSFHDLLDRLQQGESVRRTIVRQTGDGERRTFEFAAAPLERSDRTVEVVGAYVDVTERQSRIETLEQIRRNVSEVVWMSDAEKRTMDFISDSYEDVWGRTPDSLRAEPESFVEAIHEEDRDRVEAALAAQAEDPEDYDETYRVVQPDGEVRWVNDTSAGVYDEDGELTRIVGVTTDVTERKRLEEELQERVSLLDHIFNQVPTALYVKDAAGRHVRLSDYRRDPEAAIGRTDLDLYGETEFARETYADDMRVIEEGERIVNKEEYNPANGEWTLTSKVPWRGQDGEIKGLIGVSRLITEKKEYERKLNLRNRAMEEAPIGITIHDATDPDWPITYANTGFARLTGRDQRGVEGESLSVLSGDDTDADLLETLAAAVERGENESVVTVLYAADDTPFWGRISVAPVTDDTGTVTHYVGFLQDVTETKERAEEIERRLDEFGELLAEELRAPIEDARAAIAVAEGDEDRSTEEDEDRSTEEALAAIQRVEKLVDDLVAVHSFSVKPKAVFETVPTEGEDD